MVSTLLAALGSAIGHHLFYDNLDGEPVLDSDPLSSIASFYSISDQQFNVSIGTLFALLVKSLLGIAVSTVFDQFAWKAIKGRMRSIGIIDDLFSALKNGFMVLDYVLWRHYPFSMLLACIAWLLPVATVITPATLNVRMASFSNATLMSVPRVDFRQFKFATLLDYANTPQFMYETSKPEVQRILVNTAVQGGIMPIKPPSINSSWTLEFYGPALKCEHVDDDIHRDITQNVQSAILNISTFGVDDRKDLARVAYTFGYLAWPADTSSTNKTLPFEKRNGDSTYSLRINKGNPAGAPETDERPTNPTSIFIAAFPHMAEQGDRTEKEMNDTALDAVILNCRLYNASYLANFTYVNGEQNIRIPHVRFLDEAIPVSVSQTMNIENPSTNDLHQMERYSYVSMIDELGDLLSGEIHQKTERQLDSLKADGNEINWGANETVIQLDNTNVMLTPLARTKELNFLYAAMSLNNQWNNSKNAMPVNQTASTSIPLSDALEEMFQNITVSMMSSDRFQYVFYPVFPDQLKNKTDRLLRYQTKLHHLTDARRESDYDRLPQRLLLLPTRSLDSLRHRPRSLHAQRRPRRDNLLFQPRLLQHQILHYPPNNPDREYIDSLQRRRRQRAGPPSGPYYRRKYLFQGRTGPGPEPW